MFKSALKKEVVQKRKLCLLEFNIYNAFLIGVRIKKGVLGFWTPFSKIKSIPNLNLNHIPALFSHCKIL